MSDMPRFDLGPIVATPAALEALQRNKMEPIRVILKHASCIWGDLCDEDKQSNEDAITTGARILSAYHLPDGTKIWVITDAEIDDEHHRQATTILLPEDY